MVRGNMVVYANEGRFGSFVVGLRLASGVLNFVPICFGRVEHGGQLSGLLTSRVAFPSSD